MVILYNGTWKATDGAENYSNGIEIGDKTCKMVCKKSTVVRNDAKGGLMKQYAPTIQSAPL